MNPIYKGPYTERGGSRSVTRGEMRERFEDAKLLAWRTEEEAANGGMQAVFRSYPVRGWSLLQSLQKALSPADTLTIGLGLHNCQ